MRPEHMNVPVTSYSFPLSTLMRFEVAAFGLEHRMKPFFSAALSHFDPDRKTWTASLADKVLGSPEPQPDEQKANEQPVGELEAGGQRAAEQEAGEVPPEPPQPSAPDNTGTAP